MLADATTNPLLDLCNPPRFGEVRAHHVGPALDVRVTEAEAALEAALSPDAPRTWEGLIAPIDAAEERLDRAWGPADHLCRVLRDEGMRAVQHEGSARYMAHRMRLNQDERLLRAATTLSAQPLSPERQKVLRDLLRELRMAGVHLPPDEKRRLSEVRVQLERLSATFAEHLTDATDAWRLPLTEAQVAPLPPSLRATARAQALRDAPDAPEGRYALSLHLHALTPFLSHQPDRALREVVYEAHTTLASAGERANGPVVCQTLTLRAELARRLGFASFAEYALQTEMAGSPEEVRTFLLDIADRVQPQAKRELAQLSERARQDGVDSVQRYDLGFYRERIRQDHYGFSDQDLRVYFPLPRVMAGVSQILGRLFGLTLRVQAAGGEPFAWHKDLQLLEITDESGALLARILVDVQVRPGKRTGAWVSGMVPGLPDAQGRREVPLIVLCANFPPAGPDTPCLLSHDNVRTLLHELGHALHHGLSQSRERRAIGTRGVPRDSVELPSKLLEQWVWQPEALSLLSGHLETGQPMPADLLLRMRAARDITRGLDVLRQVELSLFDLDVHHGPPPEDEDGVRRVLAAARARVALVPAPACDRFENMFHHIFAAGYASRYYGYLWAEVLAADAFARFEEEGIWSRPTGDDLRSAILSRGGSAEMMDLFVAFRGRKPTPDALLRQIGCAAA